MSILLKEIKKIYTNEVRVIKIPLLYTKTINAYIKKIEDGHKKAVMSKLVFKEVRG